jgi:predicted DNA-binding helix-hairpin-helix protein
VTQFVTGGAGESDLELLQTSSYLIHTLHLQRVYFSGFNPVPDTPLEGLPPLDPTRNFRLYQASFLLRDYGFELEEMPFAPDGNLPLPTDPKLAWAQQNLHEKPVEINKAQRHELLRIPGIGLKSVDEILKARRTQKFRDLTALRKIGIIVARAAPFLLLDGRRPETQMALF